MVRELEELGIKLVVCVWPSVSPLSENHPVMEQRGYFIGTQYGPMAHADWPDKGVASTVQVAFYDATNPEAREFMWSKVKANYLDPYGITAFWLDACEPELKPGLPGEPALLGGSRPGGRQQLSGRELPHLPRGPGAPRARRGHHPQPLGLGGQSALRRRPVVR